MFNFNDCEVHISYFHVPARLLEDIDLDFFEEEEDDEVIENE